MADLCDAALMDSLECPVCLTLYEEPKLLTCGHTVCANCVTRLSEVWRPTTEDWLRMKHVPVGRHVACPECRTVTQIPSAGLLTNYRLLGLIQKLEAAGYRDAHPCSTCHKKTPSADLFTCKTCEHNFQSTPVWICSLCALKSHKAHEVTESSKATKEDTDGAKKKIANHLKLAKTFAEDLEDRFANAFRIPSKIIAEFEKNTSSFDELERELSNRTVNMTKEQVDDKVKASKRVLDCYESAAAIGTTAIDEMRRVLDKCYGDISTIFLLQKAAEATASLPERPTSSKRIRATRTKYISETASDTTETDVEKEPEIGRREKSVRRASSTKPKPPSFLKFVPSDPDSDSNQMAMSRTSSCEILTDASSSSGSPLKESVFKNRGRTLARSGPVDFSSLSPVKRGTSAMPESRSGGNLSTSVRA
ncbi:TAM-1 protein [Aphelenchoides avenae]|nr:TAM-1 protein [Aphelenchus avenae]